MSKSFENSGSESLEHILGAIESATDADLEHTTEREIMTKARQLFDYPDVCNEKHRLPDTVEDLELVIEKISYLIDRDDPDKPLLTYRRIYIKSNGEPQLDLGSQTIEYTEWSEELPIEIVLPNGFRESEADAEILTDKIGRMLDHHLGELIKPRPFD